MVETEAIWNEYQEKIWWYIQSRVSDKSLSEDILQDVFVKIHTKIDTVKEKKHIKGWVYKITCNTIIDHFRKKNKIKDIRETKDMLTYDSHEDTGHNVPCLDEMIGRLPDKYQVVIDLSVKKGMKQKDVSKTIGLTLSGTKTRVHRARSKLKQLLNSCCTFHCDRYGAVIDYEPKINKKK